MPEKTSTTIMKLQRSITALSIALVVAACSSNAPVETSTYDAYGTPYPFDSSEWNSEYEYLFGIHETLAYLHARGPLPSQTLSCLFDDYEQTASRLALAHIAFAPNTDGENSVTELPAAWTILDKLVEECESGIIIQRFPGAAADRMLSTLKDLGVDTDAIEDMSLEELESMTLEEFEQKYMGNGGVKPE